MPQKAKVSSFEALDLFRSRLLVYMSQARATLEEVSAETVRTRLWIENDQRTAWEGQFRKRHRALEDAQQALFSARLSSFRTEYSAEQLLYHRAKRAVEEAEAKLRVIKNWARDYDNRVQPLIKQTEKLHSVLAHDLVLAAAFLSKALESLSAYAEVKPPAGPELPTTPPQSSDPGPVRTAAPGNSSATRREAKS